MNENTCSYCSKKTAMPKGFKYFTLQGKEFFYCSRRCYVFTHETKLTKKKLTHLSRLRIKKNQSS